MSNLGYYRQPTVHGSIVVFVSEDDLWAVEGAGGIARRLTTGLGAVSRPRFSPDGSLLAFTAAFEGSEEVWVMDARGGEARRLTFLGQLCRVCGWSRDGHHVIFGTAHRQPSTNGSALWQVPVEGGEATPLPWGSGVSIAWGADGGVAIGRHSEDIARWKRYRGGRAGVIWVDPTGSGDFRKLVEVEGNLASPLWIGDRIWFVSDHAWSGNLWSCRPDGSDLVQQTSHDHFVRFPDTDGRRIVYGCGAELWVLDPTSGETRRMDVSLGSPRNHLQRRFVPAAEYLEEVALHPAGHSLALTVRGGTWAMGNWEGPVRRVGPSQGVRHRLARWLPDGRRLVLVSDEGGEEALEVHTADGSAPPRRYDDLDVGRPLRLEVAPKGERVALTNHRQEVLVVELDGGGLTAVDQSPHGRCEGLAWSPDGRWLAWSRPTVPEAHTSAIRLYDVESSASIQVTEGRYNDVEPTFDPTGRYLFFLSARDFDPAFDAVYFDYIFARAVRPYAVTLRAELASPFLPEPRPLEEAGDGEESEVHVHVDPDGIGQRLVPFPVPLGRYDAIAAVQGRVLVSGTDVKGLRGQSWAGGGAPAADHRLHAWDWKKQEWITLLPAISSFSTDIPGRAVAVRSGHELRVLRAGLEPESQPPSDGPGRKSGRIDLDRVRSEVVPAREWAQMYRETWRLMRDHFWTADMSGVDWNAVHDRYLPLLGRVGSRSEYSDLVWEMVGELGTSHAYEMLGDYPRPPSWTVGQLAASFAWDAGEKGWRVEDVATGEAGDPLRSSPLTAPGVDVRPGDLVHAVGGVPVSRTTPPAALLVHAAGQLVPLTVSRDGRRREVTVQTLRDAHEAWYRHWVIRNRERVHEATGGRAGYVHIPDMGANGYAVFHQDYLVEATRDALLVDVRFNRGGHVSQLLLEKLARRPLGWNASRWGTANPYPSHAVKGPMVAVTNEMAGSDGDIFSHVFKLLGLGPLVGHRTWGGVIGIWPRHRHVDGSITTQPEFSFWFQDVGWQVENYGTDPDVEVDIRPQDHAAGEDPQLEEAIRILNDRIVAEDPKLPAFGERPFLGRR